jgi:secondary thiamine-phosphate synthase enzyme
MIQQFQLRLPEYRRGYHLITSHIEGHLKDLPKQGMVNIFIKHTSAGLTINENADPSVRVDFETIMNRLVPENGPGYQHTLEGLDDMPAHIKSSLIGPSLTIPVVDGRLGLGTWQGIYLCEFRNYGGARQLVITVYS